MTDDRDAILTNVEALRWSERFYSAALRREIGRTEMDLMAVASLFRNGETRLQDLKSRRLRICRIRALRLLLRCFGHVGFHVVREAAKDASCSPYRLILREREAAELPDKGKAIKISEHEWQTHRIAELVLDLAASERISQETAFERVARQEGLNYTFQTFQDHKKKLSIAAKERGYIDPTAPGLAFFMGAQRVDDIPMPRISVAKLTKVGRPRKNSGDS